MREIENGELKSASLSQLKELCGELREEILATVSRCGGHLSSNLGAVELTVSLHRVFDFPRDKIVFDVGHQCYAHKLLSGRAGAFGTLRQEGGLSGFPKRSESEYDCYGTGHAGTAISAALGFAKARDLKGEKEAVIALVGDGSFNNGLIYEALNSLKILNTRILIILNDNGMSISETVGSMAAVLKEMRESDAAQDAEGSPGTARRDGGETAIPEEDVRLFEHFGLTYTGVVNGHDMGELLASLERAKHALEKGSVLLHVHTRKGYGHAFAERAPTETHGVGAGGGAEYSRALGEELTALAKTDSRIVAVTAAMTDSLGLRGFFETFPERAFDVGICEEHAAVLSASLAAAGMRPYYAIYSTFLQRAYDEIVHDVCAQNLPVVFCVDRAGVTGRDGETHQGVFDLSYLTPIPNLTIAVPKDISEFRAMLRMSVRMDGPLAIRYPREGSEGVKLPETDIEIGKFEVLHSTMSDMVLLAAGERCLNIARRVLKRAQNEGLDFTLVNARFVKPLDEGLLSSLKAHTVITIEDNVLIGGLGDSVARFYRGSGKEVVSFGYPDVFIPHGAPYDLMR
ncbi:MAG TPA: 1-deoxy-D-xylulose-5-phosphate synthase, partial [Candidatus Gallimonas gallistercoris]|nr:1-deoxy-D-xylulose-5-phosphate synthase [Candidatus Gallimonas gallistercoris]